MADRHWKTLRKDIVFEAAPYLKVARETVELPDGRRVDDFYQVHLRPFVSVVPVTPEGRILILEQYKHGPRCVSITFPGGFSASTPSAPLGVPIGIELLGPDWSEPTLIRLAYAFEQAARIRRPPTSTPPLS